FETLKKLVVFYSNEGNTRLIAEDIAISIGADIMEIKPEKDVNSKGFFGYMIGGWQAIRGFKPPLKPLHKNPEEYEVIFVGTPIWAGRQTPAIKTFLEEHLPEGKKVAFFCTHTGGAGSALQNMRSISPEIEFLGDQEFLTSKKEERGLMVASAMKWARSIVASIE
ncbi:MAG: flavodoxin family protein, partial [Thermoplasmatota archaeon]